MFFLLNEKKTFLKTNQNFLSFRKKTELNTFFNKKLKKQEEEMSQNEAAEDNIFAKGKAAPNDVSHIDQVFKEPPLRSISTNLTENKENVNEVLWQC